jgi:hypothetical protein
MLSFLLFNYLNSLAEFLVLEIVVNLVLVVFVILLRHVASATLSKGKKMDTNQNDKTSYGQIAQQCKRNIYT